MLKRFVRKLLKRNKVSFEKSRKGETLRFRLFGYYPKLFVFAIIIKYGTDLYKRVKRKS